MEHKFVIAEKPTVAISIAKVIGAKNKKDCVNLFESAQARAIADWLVGMNISRLYSCLYKQNYSVGRVQTPTLAVIVKRGDEIANFKKEKYYTEELSTNGFTVSTDRIDDEVVAEQLINLVGDKIEIIAVIAVDNTSRINSFSNLVYTTCIPKK